jgi:tetratricopeptide (TPR) repeat protein
MRLPTYAVLTILALLYVVAAYTRLNGTGTESSPYFSGASAMSYRSATLVADGRPLDAPDPKAGWPEGYVPASYRAAGAEVALGWGLKAVRYFSEIDGRVFAARFTALFFSLCVFTVYAFVRRLWDCQAAGLIAAGFVAVFAPLVDATNGRRLDHTSVALVLMTLHALALLRYHRRRSPLAGALAAAVTYLVVAAWEPGIYYAAAVVCAVAFAPSARDSARRWTLVAHAAAVVAACALLPYLQSARAVYSWPVALVASATAADFLPARFHGGLRRGLIVAATALVVVLATAPLRQGAEGGVPVVQFLWVRLRFLFAKPESSALLPPAIRAVWSIDHAPPSAHALLLFFLPASFLAAAAFLSARERLRRNRKAVALAAVLGAAGAIAFVVDRSAAAMGAMALAPLLSMSGISISSAARSRGLLVVAGAYLMFAQMAFPLGAANPTLQVARSGGFAYRDPNRFLWVSMEDTDRALVRFVASRTTVADAFLGSSDVTALLLTFSGRTSVPLAGALTRTAAGRNADLVHALYEDEASLYETCRHARVAYVLYSVDMLLDATRYSPRYLAGVPALTSDSMVYRMHFEPESLRQFTLVYENDHYRLYKVSREPETIFLTDHPPVYQRAVLERVGGNVDTFRRRVVELLLTYREARAAAGRGDFDGALRKLNWCLEQAPGYTLARIAVGTTLTQAGRLEEARDVLLGVLSYAPDNADALYHTAYALAALDETARAREYLDVLFGVAGDPDLVEKARLLKTFIEQQIPVTPRAAPQ